ncbi:MAG: hypothetical protein AAB554_05570 [Patescibacteria group bacterium]
MAKIKGHLGPEWDIGFQEICIMCGKNVWETGECIDEEDVSVRQAQYAKDKDLAAELRKQVEASGVNPCREHAKQALTRYIERRRPGGYILSQGDMFSILGRGHIKGTYIHGVVPVMSPRGTFEGRFYQWCHVCGLEPGPCGTDFADLIPSE